MKRWFLLVTLPAALAAQSPQQPKPDPDDPGPPVLKRGGGGARKPAKDGPDLTTVKPQPPSDEPPPPRAHERPAAIAGRGEDELIERAREASYNFDAGLPDFLCDQLTMRYTSKTLKPEWKVQDRIELELMYLDRKEDYRNIRRNGKLLKKGSPEETGTWSSGDFGTILVDLLSTSTNANFKKRGSDSIAGIQTVIYDYTVEKANSHWTVRLGGSIKPAYKGAIWVDPETARVLRVEMQARQLPETYLADKIEMTTEYGWVAIGGKKYLLPVSSQNLACTRGTFECTRNDLTYKNYRKFSAESSISTTDSSVTFDGEEPPKTVPAPAPAKTKPKKK